MSEILQKRYCSVFNNPDMADLDCISDDSPQHTTSDMIRGAPDVLVAINKIKHDSAVCSDRFLVYVLKVCRCQLASPPADLWRNSLDAAYIPENFLSQSVVAVY